MSHCLLQGQEVNHVPYRNLIDTDVPDITLSTAWARKIAAHKFMLLQKKGPKAYLTFRHYPTDKLTRNLSETPREIDLDVFQTKDLLEGIESIRTALLIALGEGQPSQSLFGPDGKIGDDDIENNLSSQDFSLHIGRNTFVRVENGKQFVDIRRFYFGRNKCLLPSPRGITLFKAEFDAFIQKVNQITNLWRDLDTMINYSLTHENEEDYNQCEHCSPKCPT